MDLSPIVGAREEAEDVAEDVNESPIGRVQQKSLASIEWADRIAADAQLRQRSLARSAALKKGSRTYHEEHGSGTIVAVDDVAGVTVSFDDGETHMYNLVSQRKLKPLLDEAHQLTSDALFSLVACAAPQALALLAGTLLLSASVAAMLSLMLHPENPLKFWERRDVVALDEARLDAAQMIGSVARALSTTLSKGVAKPAAKASWLQAPRKAREAIATLLTTPSPPSEQRRSAKSGTARRARRAAAKAAPAPTPWSRCTGPAFVVVLLTLLGSAALLSLHGGTGAGAPPAAANAPAASSAVVRPGLRPHDAPLPPATARSRFRRVVRMLVHALACGHAYLAQSSATPLGGMGGGASRAVAPPPPMAPPTVLCGTNPDCYFKETEPGAAGGLEKREEGLGLDECARAECVPPARPPARPSVRPPPRSCSPPPLTRSPRATSGGCA
jgi:hypothetical protein